MSGFVDKICLDFDGTLIPYGPIWDRNVVAFSGVRDAVARLRLSGYKIYIFTTRLSETWCRESCNSLGYGDWRTLQKDQRDYIIYILKKEGIYFDEIGAEKVPCLKIFDDLAVSITPEYPLPAAIYDFLGVDGG